MSDASLEPPARLPGASVNIFEDPENLMPPEAATGHKGDAIELGLEVVELELALDAAHSDNHGFNETVTTAVRSVGGEVLFCLPASGLAEGQQKIAAVRIPVAGARSLVFVLLSDDGARLTVRTPDEETAAVASFSKAFIDLLERL